MSKDCMTMMRYRSCGRISSLHDMVWNRLRTDSSLYVGVVVLARDRHSRLVRRRRHECGDWELDRG